MRTTNSLSWNLIQERYRLSHSPFQIIAFSRFPFSDSRFNFPPPPGSGSFGIVYQAQVVETGETVAIKKVFQDKRYKNRELQIMKELKHSNIVELKHAFYTSGDKPGETYLNVVMEYCSDTVYRVMKHYNKLKQPMPLLYVKVRNRGEPGG